MQKIKLTVSQWLEIAAMYRLKFFLSVSAGRCYISNTIREEHNENRITCI